MEFLKNSINKSNDFKLCDCLWDYAIQDFHLSQGNPRNEKNKTIINKGNNFKLRDCLWDSAIQDFHLSQGNPRDEKIKIK